MFLPTSLPLWPALRCWRTLKSACGTLGLTPVLNPDVRPTWSLMFIDIFLQLVIRLYAIPLSAFTGEEEEEEGTASEEDVELIDSMLR